MSSLRSSEPVDDAQPHRHAFGDLPPADITTADVARLLDRVAADGVSRRTVNRHREVVVAIFNYALRRERRGHWGLRENPAAATPKRRENGPGRLEVFTVEHVEALARAAATGAWRAVEAPPSATRARAGEASTAASRSAADTGALARVEQPLTSAHTSCHSRMT